MTPEQFIEILKKANALQLLEIRALLGISAMPFWPHYNPGYWWPNPTYTLQPYQPPPLPPIPPAVLDDWQSTIC